MKPREIPIPQMKADRLAKFWSLIDRRGSNECWPWLGSANDVGYGVFSIAGLAWKPHRIAYTLLVGPIPGELTIDHVRERGCTTKLCCNPAHMEPVTQSVNKKRSANPNCPCGEPRSGPLKSQWLCRYCQRERIRLYQQRYLEKVAAQRHQEVA